MTSNYLLRLVHAGHWGFVLSLLYGLATSLVLWAVQPGSAVRYLESFLISFGCLLSGGFVIGTALFVMTTEKQVPEIVERSFAADALADTDYAKYKMRYESKVGAALAAASYILIAYGIFYFCQFPFSGWAEVFMIAFACLQYGLLVYIGRKIYFIAHMLNALAPVRLDASVLNSEIGQIASYVNIATTMTIASVYANASGYYYGPFEYHSVIGQSSKLLLLFMVVAAAPVIVMFNFYPRVVLRILYERSIEQEVAELKKRLADTQLTAAEFETVLIDYDRLKQAELKERLQLTLSDAPMIAAIIIALVGLLVKT